MGGIRKNDLASGLPVAFNGAVASLPGGRFGRRIHADAAVTIVDTEGNEVDLPDYGAGYVWDVGFSAIVSGSGVYIL